MDPVDEIHRELSGKPAAEPTRTSSKRRGGSNKIKAPLASEGSSGVAQRWMDAAEARGLVVPFNTNWLAHQISARVVHDPRLRPLLQNEERDKVIVWVNKMTDKFWDEYVDGSIAAKDVSKFFLQEAWEDVRDYAWDCLRAAYLKAHGRRVEPTEYRSDDPLHTALRKIHVDGKAEELLAVDAEPGEVRKLDDHRRAVIRSRKTET